MSLLPHTVDRLIKDNFEVSEVMRAWMEDINRTSSLNDAHSRGLIFVSSLDDLPEPVFGVINLIDNYTYWFLGEVDLLGSRFVCGQNTVILGSSSENSKIISTGLSDALISSEWSLPIRHVTFEAETIFDLDASSNVNQAIDWYGVNLVSEDIGRIANYSNFVVNSMAFLGASGLVFDGTVGTISFSNTLFVGNNPGTIIEIPPTATISRRFRIVYSSFVVIGAGVGIDLSTSASIPVEGYILDTCNFSGGGVYTQGVQFDDNKSRFIQNRGVHNSLAITGYVMQGNTTSTVISATNTPVKVAGATTKTAISQKFDVSSTNRATYEGAITRSFKVTVVASLSSGSNHQIGIYLAKDGSVISESETYVTTNSGGRLENGTVQTLTSLDENQYIEVFVENATSTSNVLVENLSVIISTVDQ